MTLRWSGASADHLAVTFARESAMTDKRALRFMRSTAKKVMIQSQKNTPVDWHGPGGRLTPPAYELQRSHRLVERRGGMNRIETTVEVGGYVGSVNTDLYASWIHNGDYKLGRMSIQKQASTPGARVGPGFLENALIDHESAFDGMLDEIMESLIL